jgi:hypothetical protein
MVMMIDRIKVGWSSRQTTLSLCACVLCLSRVLFLSVLEFLGAKMPGREIQPPA